MADTVLAPTVQRIEHTDARGNYHGIDVIRWPDGTDMSKIDFDPDLRGKRKKADAADPEAG